MAHVLERHRSALHLVHPLEALPPTEWRALLPQRDETLRVARRAKRYAAYERVLELDRFVRQIPLVGEQSRLARMLPE